MSIYKKIMSAAVTAALAVPMCIVPARAGATEIQAVKTAQWTAQESAAGYDMRVHGWTAWETAAYMSFTLPENVDMTAVTEAELVLTTISASASATAYLYAADASAFENGAQYEGASGAPAYTETAITSFASPAAAGEFAVDITDSFLEYINSDNSGEIAFRIDMKSQDINASWVIGSCTNGGTAPYIRLSDGASSDGIVNGRFSNGLEGWSVTNAEAVSAADGKLTANGTASVSQVVSGIESGVYDLSAEITNDSIGGECYLYAKTKGHTTAMTALPRTTEGMTVTVPGIQAEDGECEIGLYVNGRGKVTLDNVKLTASAGTRLPLLKGGEISKLTYIEDMGGKFRRADGSEADALQIMAENGFNLARIRLLDDPGKGRGDGSYYLPEGYMTEEDCLELARRAKSKGMQICFTIAYSDYWVDGEKQMVPAAWQAEIDAQGLTGETLVSYLEDKVYTYTADVLEKLKAQGTPPEYVSVGNEIQVGMLFNKWGDNNGLYNNAAYLARFLNAGAKAVREVLPEAKIIVHSDNGGKVYTSRRTFINAIANVDFDVVGVSYYPYYNAEISIDSVVSEFARFINEMDKDVIIMETGYNWAEFKPGGEWEGQLQNSGYYQDVYGESQEGQHAFLTELYAKLKQVAGGRCIGDMYWDPIMIHDGGTGKIGWAIREDDDYTDSNVVPNSTIFDFDGKATEGQLAMRYNTNSDDPLLITDNVGAERSGETLTMTVNGTGYSSVADRYGDVIFAVPYPETGELVISDWQREVTKAAPEAGVLVDLAEAEGVSVTFDIAPPAADTAAVIIKAVYDNGLLSGVECENVVLSAGQTKVETTAAEGARVMLWSGGDMTPLAPAVTAGCGEVRLQNVNKRVSGA